MMATSCGSPSTGEVRGPWKDRVGLALVGACLLGACEEGDRFSVDSLQVEEAVVHFLDEPERTLRGVSDLTIGLSSGHWSEEFSEISGLAGDAEGRIIVVDRFNNDVRVFGPSGNFLTVLGGPGAGPGELSEPCCPSFGPDGHLWVRDVGNSRYNAYALGQDPRYVKQVRATSMGPLAKVPLTFAPDGSLIDVGAALDVVAGNIALTRHRLAMDGSLLRDERVPSVPPGRAPIVEERAGLASLGRMSGTITMPVYVPRHEVAHSPTGDWAEMITSDFAIRWYASDGTLRQVILSEAGPGPHLTDSQREFQDRQVERRGEIPGFSPTDRQPPLSRLLFDQDGRLWVLYTTSEGPARADVIGLDGSYEAVAEWPLEVELMFVAGYTALGVERAPSGLMRAVRLRFDSVSQVNPGG